MKSQPRPRLVRSLTQAQLRRRNHRNLFQSRRYRGPCMAAWQGREEPSARQGSKLDPTPARVGGVPSGGLVGWWVGREAGRSGRPQQEETAAWQYRMVVAGQWPSGWRGSPRHIAPGDHEVNPGARYRGPWTGALDRIKVWDRSLVCCRSMCSCLGGSGTALPPRPDTYAVTVCTVGGVGHTSLCRHTRYRQL